MLVRAVASGHLAGDGVKQRGPVNQDVLKPAGSVVLLEHRRVVPGTLSVPGLRVQIG